MRPLARRYRGIAYSRRYHWPKCAAGHECRRQKAEEEEEAEAEGAEPGLDFCEEDETEEAEPESETSVGKDSAPPLRKDTSASSEFRLSSPP